MQTSIELIRNSRTAVKRAKSEHKASVKQANYVTEQKG